MVHCQAVNFIAEDIPLNCTEDEKEASGGFGKNVRRIAKNIYTAGNWKYDHTTLRSEMGKAFVQKKTQT